VDITKHAMEYASHGVACLAPRTGYNDELDDVDNVFVFDTPEDMYRRVGSMLESLNAQE